MKKKGKTARVVRVGCIAARHTPKTIKSWKNRNGA